MSKLGFVPVILCLAVVLSARGAAADGTILPPTKISALGTFGGIKVTTYEGIFEGQSTTSRYRVPYRITAPDRPNQGNRTIIVEPPHFAVGPASVTDTDLGSDFIFSRGFSHGSVGYGTEGNRMLDPEVPGVFIEGGHAYEWEGVTYVDDDEIIVDFARALETDAAPRAMLGRLEYFYITGFSDSSATVLRILDQGWADNLFDLAFPYIPDGTNDASEGGNYSPEPQAVLARGDYGGKLVMVGSEGGEDSFLLVDRGETPKQYRYYQVAGAAHVGDSLFPSDFNDTTPVSYLAEVRAHLLQADRWVKRRGPAPPPSSHVRVGPYDFNRDANGNAYVYETLAKRTRLVPRLPMVELGEARFHAIYDAEHEAGGFFGSYDGGAVGTPIPTLAQLRDPSGRPYGFKKFKDYLKAFRKALDAQVHAGLMTDEDRDAYLCRAELGRDEGKTYTEMYRDHYDLFLTRCKAPSCGD